MNYLKKKLKPFASGLPGASNSHSNNKNKNTRDLEDDLYDEYVVEAPPHPSELLALGVDPSEIDVNDPEKLKELYRRAKEEGKDRKTNSVLLAKQRQKEEIEEKKKTREEWKFFDSLTARVEQVVKDSQKTLDHLKESSAIDKLTEPEYELRLSADEIFKSSGGVKIEKEGADNWIDFNEDQSSKKQDTQQHNTEENNKTEDLDQVISPKTKTSKLEDPVAQQFILDELLDLGIDLRTAEQKIKAVEKDETRGQKQLGGNVGKNSGDRELPTSTKIDIDLKSAARPRPRPKSNQTEAEPDQQATAHKVEPDPFDTSFVSAPLKEEPSSVAVSEGALTKQNEQQHNKETTKIIDPFDTSYLNL